MPISKEIVDYVAHLSRIDLRTQELEKISGQLQEILSFIDRLGKADIKDTPATSHILPVQNVLRPDLNKPSLPSDKTLANSPEHKDAFFVVPKVVE